jgi:NADH-quinone oxidoreductase subunit L
MYRSYYMTFSGEYRGGEGHGHEHNEDPHSAVAAHSPALSAKVHASDGAVHAHGTGHAARTAHDADHGHGHGAPAAHGGHGAAAHDDPGDAAAHHGGTPHESPWQITIVLATLAAGSVLTLFLGIPMLWTHSEPIVEHWLAPVLLAEVSWPQHPHAMEWLFQGLGVLAATVGFVAARAVYKDNKNEAALLAMIERWKGVWTTVYNKYYVDEAYAWLVLKPAARVARALSWFDGRIIDGIVNAAGLVTRGFANIDGALDTDLVDGAVNGLADLTQGAGRSLRRIQTGRIQTYLYGALGGALVVVLVNFLLP